MRGSRWAAGLFVAALIIGGVAPTMAGATHQKHVSKGQGKKRPSATTTTTAPAKAIAPVTFAGTAQPVLTAGKVGSLDVTFIGKPVSGVGGTRVPVEVWNGTKTTFSHLDVSGSASSGGKVVGSGDSTVMEPVNLAPGNVAFGGVFFEQNLPATATFNLAVNGHKGQSNYYVNVKVTQANLVPSTFETTVVGTVTNENKQEVKGPVQADAFCFTGGTFEEAYPGYTSGSGTVTVTSGGTASFSIDITETVPCTSFLVGSSGYGKTGF